VSLYPDRCIAQYRLLEELGVGGMGVVWKAEDTKLNRLVAIKFLPEDRTGGETRRKRFFAEARMAAGISDARVAQVFELGRVDGTDFIVMELVEGATLGKMIEGGPLPVERTVELAKQIARGLGQAHGRGLVHRDLKPSNVIVGARDEVKIIDFGVAAIASPLDAAAGESAPTLEVSHDVAVRGGVAGTLGYMAPEQLRGDAADHRADVFALGVLCYEMLTGRRPPRDASSVSVAALRELAPSAPQPLEDVIARAVSEHPDDRFANMTEMEQALVAAVRPATGTSGARWRRGGWLVLTAILLAVLAVTLKRKWTPAPGVEGASPTMTVLPFEVRRQSNPDDARFAGHAFAETLAIRLAEATGLTVLPVRSPDEETGPPDPVEAGEDRGATHVVTGVLTRTARKDVEARMQLVDVEKGEVVWGEQDRRRERELPELAGLAARAIVDALDLSFPRSYGPMREVLGSDRMAGSEPLTSLLAARHEGDIAALLAASKKLVDAFPEEPGAWAQRASTLATQYAGRPESATREQLEQAIRVLDRLDPDNPYGSYLRAWLAEFEGRPHDAIDELSQLLEREDLAPAFRASVLTRRAVSEANVGQIEPSLKDLERARELQPADAYISRIHARTLLRAGRTDDAARRARQAAALAPGGWSTWLELGAALEQLGETSRAVQAVRRACEISDGQSACAYLALMLLKAEQPEKAAEAARHAKGLPASPYGQYNLACYASLAGRVPDALDHLRSALDNGFADRLMLEDPDLEAARRRPAFDALEQRLEQRLASGGSD
jgi:serine/threonine protein kinase/tetratricopeptide (TPR) repeat protein